VGYAGGTKKAPTYHSLGDHTETFEVDFDPKKIAYERLLEMFFAAHDPHARAWSTQYKPAVFHRGEAQERAAKAMRDAIAARAGKPVKTEILPFTGFTRAEDYHQKYYLQQHAGLTAEIRDRYPSFCGFVDSTAAARLNGYVGGHGTSGDVERDLPRLGLSKASGEKLLAEARRERPGPACK